MDNIDYMRYYAHWHDTSDGHFDRMAAYFENKLGPLLPKSRNSRVLDIGCGMGFAIGGLQKLGYANVEGIDSDVGQVQAATARGLPVTQVSIEDFPSYMALRAQAYDVILAIDVLEHVPPAHQLAFLRAVRESLKAGGQFICQVPNANSGIASRYRYNDWTHHTSFAELSLDFVLYNAGFDNITIREADPNLRPPLSLSSWKLLVRWALLGGIRAIRRLEFALELGTAKGIPLTPNILAVAYRPV